jgi:hypothetical protein
VADCKKRSIDKNILVIDLKSAFRTPIGPSSLDKGYTFRTISMLPAADNSWCTSAGVEGVRANEAIKRKLLFHPLHDLAVALLLLRGWTIIDWL